MAAGCYDLVLMDIQMPVQDGVSAAREIRTLPDPNGAVPILALTANTLSDQRRAYLDAGMQAVSYTHLDVYKRQSHCTPTTPMCPNPIRSSR